MKSPLPSSLLRRWAAFVVATVIAACGGGVGEGGTGATTNYAAGPITGFGSVIVNDITFADDAATIEDGEGSGRSRTDLRLGMAVEIDSDAIQTGSGGAFSNARSIRFDSALVGPVESVDPLAGSFTVLGQRVAVDETTVWEFALRGRLAALSVGQVVEVHAMFDAAGSRYRATRVERRIVAPTWKLRGFVAQVEPQTQTLRLGTGLFAYGNAANVPADLRAGMPVRLSLRSVAPVGPLDRYQVLAFGTPLRALADLPRVNLKGLVTQFSSSVAFELDGRAIDASAASFPDGTAGLGLGARVEVEGTVRAGILRATQVRLRSDQSERDRGFELRGAIEGFSAADRSFTLRGMTVTTTRPDLQFNGGSAADLRNGRNVKVRGRLASDGSALEALRIDFE